MQVLTQKIKHARRFSNLEPSGNCWLYSVKQCNEMAVRWLWFMALCNKIAFAKDMNHLQITRSCTLCPVTRKIANYAQCTQSCNSTILTLQHDIMLISPPQHDMSSNAKQSFKISGPKSKSPENLISYSFSQSAPTQKFKKHSITLQHDRQIKQQAKRRNNIKSLVDVYKWN